MEDELMYCKKCGKEIDNEAVICVHCGCATGNIYVAIDDAPSVLFAILGFLFPIVGLILFLAFKNSKPLKARSAGKGALIGFCLNVFVTCLWGGFMLGALGSML